MHVIGRSQLHTLVHVWSVSRGPFFSAADWMAGAVLLSSVAANGEQ
jgi:hypothetical protein